MPPRQRPVVEGLANIPFFAFLPSPELAELASQVRVRRFRKGETVIHIGDPGESLFLIHSGQVKLTRPLPSGDEAIVGLCGPGDFFGELSVLDGRPHAASVCALTLTETLVLPRAIFCTYLRKLSQQYGHESPTGMVIAVSITQGDLANMVGASRQRVNWLLATWQDGRLIRLERYGRIVLLSVEALQHVAVHRSY